MSDEKQVKSAKELIEDARKAGHDPLGLCCDPEAVDALNRATLRQKSGDKVLEGLKEKARTFVKEHFQNPSEEDFWVVFNAMTAGYLSALEDQKE